MELEDVAAIKFRAITPPWQRGAERQQMSLQLQHRIAAAAAGFGGPAEPCDAANWAGGLQGLGSCWEDGEDDTRSKLQEVRPLVDEGGSGAAAGRDVCWGFGFV
jgi:hypothetical protein